MGKFKHHTKKINKQKKSHQTQKHKGGCDAPFIPDPDGVWERTNGIKSGTFYDLLQFYKFIDWTTCDQMYKLGKDTKLSSNKVTSLQAITEAKLNANFRGYTIYDTTNQIENQSHSFIFGNATVDTVNKKVIFKQAPKDRVGNKILKYSFNYMDEINLIIEKEKKEIFIFSAKDAKFTLGLKTGLEMPTTRINKIKDAIRQNRKTIEEMEDQLTQTQKKDRQIFANRSKKGMSNSMNIGGARTKTRKYKSQNGGDDNPKIYTISNNGVPPNEAGMSNQCLWISISDYFKYHKNETKSVRELKDKGGIDPDNKQYDNTEFDIYNINLKNNIENICVSFNLLLHFIYIYQGKIANYCLSEDKKKIKPFQIINPDGKNKIYIATYGRHFELITQIGDNPELYRLPKAEVDEILLNQEEYHAKIPIKDGPATIIYQESQNMNNSDTAVKNAKIESLIESKSLFEYNIKENTNILKNLCKKPITKDSKEKITEFNTLLKINRDLLKEVEKDIEKSPEIINAIDTQVAIKLQTEAN
jgi:hypothetical protein